MRAREDGHPRDELLERELEIAALLRGAERASGGAGLVAFVEGPAGIGKTRLLHAAIAGARRAGMEILSARASELERDIPFGVVRALFAPVLRRAGHEERQQLLAGAAALALSALGEPRGDAAGAGASADSLAAALHGLHWLTSNLAQRPLMIAVDDAHWCDRPSLRFLAYLANRIEELPALLLVTARPFEAQGQEALLDSIGAAGRDEVLRPKPLSEAAVAVLVRRALGETVDERFALACHRAGGGNPLLVHELLSTLADSGVRPTASEIERMRETTPTAVSRSVQQRLRGLDATARALARAVALLGDEAELKDAALVAGIADLDEMRAAADQLAQLEIFAAGLPMSFAHPMIRSAVYSTIPPAERGYEHSRIASMLQEQGADVDRIAAHLLMAEHRGEESAVASLREGATRALASGASDAAATYLRRALAEPPTDEQRPGVMLELSIAEARTDLRATARMREALALSGEPHERAEIALVLGRTLGLAGRHSEAVDVLEGGLQEPAGDETLAFRLEAELAGHCLHAAEKLPLGFEHLARVSIDAAPKTPAEQLLQVIAAFGLVSAGYLPPNEAAEIALAAAANRSIMEEESSSLLFFIAETLVFADRLEDATNVLDGMIADARRRGSPPGVALASAFRCQVALRRGAVLDATADGRAALEVVDSEALGYCRPYALSFLIDALVERGALSEAAELLEQEDSSERWPQLWQFGLLLGSRGRLRFAEGRFEEAAADLRACGQRLARWRPRNPASVPWRSEAAVALAALGQTEEAERLVAWELKHARAFGAARGLGVALRASGLVRGGAQGIALLRESVEALESSSSRLEHARALADLGAALRRSGARNEARELLRSALDAAVRCGASTLAKRVHGELLASGARPRRAIQTGAGSLTGSELRVAQLAVKGRTNREIAQALFVSLRTVETHLTHIYRKLGIAARSELAKVLEQT